MNTSQLLVLKDMDGFALGNEDSCSIKIPKQKTSSLERSS